MQISSGIEYRFDDTEQLDTTTTDRTTWLFRNNFKYQLTPDWRLVGKLNHAFSDSSLGQFYDGGYTEAVIGYGYRPVRTIGSPHSPSTPTSTTFRRPIR